jgi:ribose 5-phosphate isomerase A
MAIIFLVTTQTCHQGNLILDCNFGPIADPASLASLLNGRAGIVEHGLFISLESDVIVADANGCQHLSRKLA